MRQESCGRLIKQIHDAIGKQVNNRLRKDGLTMTQVRIMVELGSTAANTMSLKELECRFCVAQSTVAGIVRRLEAKKLIKGFTDPNDNRVKLVRLTPKGKKLREAKLKEIEEAEKRLLSNLTEEEQQDFLRMLHLAYNGIK